MSEGFPLLTTKKIPFRLIATELMWFLRGDTNIKYLVDNDCHIWDGDAYKRYQTEWMKENPPFSGPYTDPCLTQDELINKIKTDADFAKKWGDLGPIYGKQWRNWTKFEDESKEHNEWYISSEPIDQIQNLINDIKTNPDSRRLMVNAWNVGELDQMTLPPCHYGFQVYTRELSLDERKQIFEDRGYVCDVWPFNGDWHGEYDGFGIPTRAISLMWNQRSVDTFLGLPFNIASYGLLLEIIAKEVNMIPDELIGNLGDTHLYLNHIEQAKEQIGRKLDLEERRAIVTQEMFNQIYNAGDSSILTHSEIDQFDIPRIKTREPYPLPKLFFKYEKETYVDNYELDGFILKDYQSHPHIKAPLSN
jgi:thymidylate synthase